MNGRKQMGEKGVAGAALLRRRHCRSTAKLAGVRRFRRSDGHLLIGLHQTNEKIEAISIRGTESAAEHRNDRATRYGGSGSPVMLRTGTERAREYAAGTSGLLTEARCT